MHKFLSLLCSCLLSTTLLSGSVEASSTYYEFDLSKSSNPEIFYPGAIVKVDFEKMIITVQVTTKFWEELQSGIYGSQMTLFTPEFLEEHKDKIDQCNVVYDIPVE